MRCVICNEAYTRRGATTVTLERDTATFVIKDVPARVCPNCGEGYVEENVAAELLASAERLFAAGTQIEVRRYRTED